MELDQSSHGKLKRGINRAVTAIQLGGISNWRFAHEKRAHADSELGNGMDDADARGGNTDGSYSPGRPDFE
jgi:hypothetical protein